MRNTNLQNTAVLIFANSAKVDARNKIAVSDVKLFHALTSHTIKIVKKSGLPFFHITEKEQCGTTFGERFSNAVKAVYNKGYANVITIGNDTPQLKTHHLIEANNQLGLGKTILGPAQDGGFYLMGLHQSNFDPELFVRLPWQRFGLFNKISQLFKSLGSDLYQLQVLHDIDDKADVITLLNFFRQLPFSVFNILQSFIKNSFPIALRHIGNPTKHFTPNYNNKGSPFLFLFCR
ncbi:TIGR04282 family arsenosugar biosynthesis glycosyltransferase [Flagellimonas pacifica]|uniref:DUF2064 domain-containing protein n=1 Tax=Flagellimonas pacifica TaxID=1247520 RepID=A0A285MD77_9FLAO|nr:DUF2064 domain-containing protein [Allomuricauda parva]SNY95048.1 hypothetical protein SAMN06265377_0714 [Allomuricauda parva]